MSTDEARQSALEHYRQGLQVTPEQLAQIRDAFVREVQAGLRRDGHSSLLMLPTMVDILPDGHETGEFYAINFGGTNLRVLFTKLAKDKKQVELVEECTAEIPLEYRRCHVDQLMDYVAGQLIAWADHHGGGLHRHERPVIGFCFSFPVEQTAIDAGKLIHWTKGFENEGAIGQNAAQLLADAFKRQGLSVHIAAMVNDTVATLAGIRYGDGIDANVAVIMGTGTNACYLEQLSHIEKWLPGFRPRTSDMVVNTELPGFTAPELPLLDVDEELDAESNHPGQQTFEKLTAGLYMGEITRRILLRLVAEDGLFGGQAPDAMKVAYAFTTMHVSLIYHDESAELDEIGRILQEVLQLPADQTRTEDRKQVQEVCGLVAQRSARLMATAVTGLLRQLGRDGSSRPAQRNVVAVDGGVFAHFPAYTALLHEGIRDILGEEAAGLCSLKAVEGGASFGAACVAAAANNYMKAVGNYKPPSRNTSSHHVLSPRRPNTLEL
ncbi:hypothetical protein WJX72_006374 [[Myrmecia] bisecta]|uniref:Phosphotransferase n=1 Tax=[Myrmecia] bisecta TaxID=41462 RepID=A0AAW1PT02_9CHLO